MLNWISNLFTRRGTLRETVPHIEAVAAHRAWPAPPADDPATYSVSPYVYIAVNKIAEACALVPLNIQTAAGTTAPDHPLHALLQRPNPHMSRFELFEQTIGMLELTGNAYWFLAGDAQGQPAEIWPLRPDRVSIVPGDGRFIAGYVYTLDGTQIPLEPVEVIHFKRWHPTNDYYGLSALSAARLAVNTDHAMSTWNHTTFGQNNGIPAGIVNIKEFVSDADFERIKRDWRQTYGGPQRRTAFLRGGGIEWHDIGLTYRDMDFLQGRQANRDEILNIFGVPVGLISENATEANARVAERTFIERTLWPKLVRLVGKINAELLPFWPGMHHASFEDIRPTDTQTRLNEIRTAYRVLSINEMRAQYYGLPPVEWGDRPAVGDVPSIPEPTTPEPDATKSIQTELAQWERFALRRIDQPVTRPFRVHHLPAETAFEVSARLQAAGDDAEAVQAVFADVREHITD
jgi:HK97 family phage portal protein